MPTTPSRSAPSGPPAGPTPAGPAGPYPAGPAGPSPRLGERVAARMPRWLDIPWLGGIQSAPWVILATVLVLATAAIGSLYVSDHPDRLDYGTRAYRIGPHAAELTFDVEKSPKAVAQCTVQALSVDSKVVGWKAGIVIGSDPNGRGTTTHTVVVPTSEEANVVEIEDCHITRKG